MCDYQRIITKEQYFTDLLFRYSVTVYILVELEEFYVFKMLLTPVLYRCHFCLSGMLFSEECHKNSICFRII